jgi:hypothetical protein
MSGINPGDEKLVFESSEAVQVCQVLIHYIHLLIGIHPGCVDI